MNKPLKRDVALKTLSKEHYQGLVLCKKIRDGIKNNVDLSRIKKYTDWFFKQHLIPHFEIEEKFVFNILGNEHDLIKRAISEHENLNKLFTSHTDLENNLRLIEDKLEKHIRFEERILFQEIQKFATAEEMNSLAIHHSDVKFVDDLTDPFWK